MKVLQIIDSLPSTSGGARFVVNLTRNLSKEGVKTDVLLIDGYKTHFVEELHSLGINVINLDRNTSTRYKLHYIRNIAKYMSLYDIVHVHVFPASYLVAIASLFTKKKVDIVFTEHNSFNRRAAHPIFRFIEKIVYSRFVKVVCLSEQVYKFVLDKINPERDKLVIIQNAIDAEVIINSLPYSKKELGCEESDFILLMSARLDRQKNHSILIQAFKNLPEDVILLLAGSGSLEDKLKSEISELGLTRRIHLIGSRSDIFRIMKSVDVNILASNFEGLSLAALESMASGKPFIASNVSGLDFVVNNKNLLFENNTKDIANIILKLKQDKEWYSVASTFCMKRALDFDFRQMTLKYIQVYKDVLERSKKL